MGEKTVSLGVWEWVVLMFIALNLLLQGMVAEKQFNELKQQCVEQNEKASR